jgi:two-component sensor histidine kinase
MWHRRQGRSVLSKVIAALCKIRAAFALIVQLQGMQERTPALVSDFRRRRDPQRALRLLLEELTHRVDAEFAAAIGTISRSAALAQTDEVKNALGAVRSRLENFARVHGALRVPEFRTSIDGCRYLRQLCEAINLSRLQFRGIRLELLERKFEIDSEQCWRLGMIVSELVTSAARHSFVDSPARIWVAAGRRGALIWCRVEDNGTAAANESENRGTRIVDALARELHGEFEQYHRGDVSVATVIFPAVCASDSTFPMTSYLR